MADAQAEERTIETDVPARMDRLPWSSWHVRIIGALGVSWLLDGLEVTLVGSLSGVLESKQGLSLTDPQVTSAATTYLAGAVIGSILFGWLTDRLGRKKLFLVDACDLLAGNSGQRVCARAVVVFGMPLFDRIGDRRRVRGDQLRGGRTGAGQCARDG